jgi:hypothetical protein
MPTIGNEEFCKPGMQGKDERREAEKNQKKDGRSGGSTNVHSFRYVTVSPPRIVVS